MVVKCGGKNISDDIMINSQSLSGPVSLSCEMHMYFITSFFLFRYNREFRVAGVEEMSFLPVE